MQLSKNPITAEGVCLAIGILKEHPECGLQILEIKVSIKIQKQIMIIRAIKVQLQNKKAKTLKITYANITCVFGVRVNKTSYT